MRELTADRLRELMTYNEKTGELFWKRSSGPRKAGSLAGAPNHRGYHEIRIDGKLYRRHRLAFLFNLGRWPIGVVDHADGSQANDVWDNLREGPQFKNLGNMKRPKHNRSGVKGVFWDERRKKWHAQIQIDGRSTSLGRFGKIEEAAAAYQIAAKARFGEFARIA